MSRENCSATKVVIGPRQRYHERTRCQSRKLGTMSVNKHTRGSQKKKKKYELRADYEED